MRRRAILRPMTAGSIHPYATNAYARALAPGEGAAVEVDAWGAQVLARPIPDNGLDAPRFDAPRFDAMGVYPMTPIAPDADLAAGLADLADHGLVSVVLVPDPLFGPSPDQLAGGFSLCRPFKTHAVVDRSVGDGYAPNKHHRQEIRRAERRCRVEIVSLAAYLQSFIGLYAGLVERHAIVGVAAFSDAYFAALAEDPSMVALAAWVGDEVAAMTLWFEHQGVAYNHLGASNALGYANGANYALYDAAIAHFTAADRFNLGGGAGSSDDPSDGLAVFKRGFANAETRAHLCGAVLNETLYAELAATAPASGYFPAYRG
jgi:hypothetical protein